MENAAALAVAFEIIWGCFFERERLMAKKKGCLFKIGIALLIFIGMIFVLFCMVLIMPSEEYETVNYDIPNMRDYYTHIKGDGEDKVTLMVYMVDLGP